MELVAYLHSEMMSERLQNGESLDQTLDCHLLETIAQSSRHAKSVACVGLAAGMIAINAMPIAAFAYTPEIASIQQLLARRGFNPGAIDGVKGPATRDAIINAQAFYKLETDGVIGPRTLAALQADTYEAGGSASTKMTPINYYSSNDVTFVQQLLKDRGFYNGAIDGIQGSRTTDAVINAQAFYKLEPDGIIGPRTIAALQADTYEAGGSNPAKMTPINYYSSNDVTFVQQLLKDRGFYNGAIDGIQGSRTTDAIIAAQTFYKLSIDGVAGSRTIAALQSDTYVANGSPQVLLVNDYGSQSSNTVKNLQQLLSDRGFYGGAIDGINGAMTTEAIILAQKTYGLIADGVAGYVTIAALEADSGSYVEPVITTPNNPVADGSVKQGQALLSSLGFYDGAIDGVQGSRTTEAIKKAQAFYGLPVDGVLGSSTLAALQS
jgi:peptidoglycan hydrolase-like protein with peptidoglycan-binding domain